MDRLTPGTPLTLEERREQYQWAMNTLRLGQSGNRRALHAELHRQEAMLVELVNNASGPGSATNTVVRGLTTIKEWL